MKIQEYSIIDVIYPVGSIYMSVNSSDPSSLFPDTTWQKIENRFLLGSGSSYTSGNTGGSKDAIVVSHNHQAGSNTHFVYNNGKDLRMSGGNVAPASGTHHFVYTDETNANITEATTTASTGSSGTDKNMPPYLVVNIWKRTA